MDLTQAQIEGTLARLHDLGVDVDTVKEERVKSLAIAAEHITDDIFLKLANAIRLARASSIVLPLGRYENLSRGRGWARKGRGNSVEWGEREAKGYRVGPGYWIVGSHDGYSRKDSEEWTVEHVQVGTETWTVAN